MKAGIIALFVAIASMNVTYAQTLFPLDALAKLCYCSTTDFETYMLKHQYFLSQESSNQTMQTYFSEYQRPNGARDQCILAGNNSKVVTFTTTDKDYYLQNKESLASKGYLFKSKEYDNSVKAYKYLYSNGKLTAMFCAFTLPGDAATGYSISIFKN